jgi:hypothetical protein
MTAATTADRAKLLVLALIWTATGLVRLQALLAAP